MEELKHNKKNNVLDEHKHNIERENSSKYKKNNDEIAFDVSQLKFCVYYNFENYHILDFLPKNIDEKFKSSIIKNWSEHIKREILMALSANGEMTASRLKELIGHSSSTLHENIKKLEDEDLIETRISYVGNKQRILRPKVLFVSKSPKLRAKFQKFFQGLFVDSEKTKKILAVLDENPKKYYTAEELSIKTGIPEDEIHIHLSNWESQITRGLSNFLKKKPFEKKILYRSLR